MNIQVRTDNHIEGSAELNSYVESNLSEHFARFMLEARIANRQPIVVSHNADTIHQAIELASDKLLRSLDNMVGKLTDHTSPKDLVIEAATEIDEDFE